MRGRCYISAIQTPPQVIIKERRMRGQCINPVILTPHKVWMLVHYLIWLELVRITILNPINI
jgi:hypothetical protein